VLGAYSSAMAVHGVDLEHPNIARVYDYLLNGSAYWAIDEAFAERLLRNFREFRDIALANRLFVNRVIRYLRRTGVRQFLDIGSGIFSSGNTHQIADELGQDSAVVYADNDPVTVAHAEVLLDEEGDPDRHAVICADLRNPDELWQTALDTGILDLSQPVAVLMCTVLHALQPQPDGCDDGALSVARYRELMPVGSYLGVSHVTDEGIPQEIAPKLVELKHLCETWGSSTMFCRSRTAIEALLGDFELVEPGMVWTPEWHPEVTGSDSPFADAPSYAAVLGCVGRRLR
jgi:hypothetical protein